MGSRDRGPEAVGRSLALEIRSRDEALRRLDFGGFDQQLVVEFAGLDTIGGDSPAKEGQYAGSFRYQLPLSNQWIMRLDGMIGARDDQEDLSGLRLEFRVKF